MQCLFAFVFILLLLHSGVSEASDCESGAENQPKVVRTIWVDQSGKGDFSSVQKAIDSIPSNNNQWIRNHISPGTYREKVTIPIDKPCIFLEGTHSKLTTIEWNDHNVTSDSATFSSYPDNIVARGISFKV
ncbi:hypothetical protein like AT5G26810 [Hibiscus trionum]|uniref:pectinesterase n=1 Tax=Hibiscus trionum TaxID=183268 RepID=A0A9W7MI99_HIBTR|nr:hypothetical protein like AT5G26810 [Hibiscus trionum]